MRCGSPGNILIASPYQIPQFTVSIRLFLVSRALLLHPLSEAEADFVLQSIRLVALASCTLVPEGYFLGLHFQHPTRTVKVSSVLPRVVLKKKS